MTAVESGISAARDLEVNASRAEARLQPERARVEDFLRTFAETPDFVLADPPRAGLGKSVVAQLERLAPPRITIVSCDPATLARDLAALTSYRIDQPDPNRPVPADLSSGNHRPTSPPLTVVSGRTSRSAPVRHSALPQRRLQRPRLPQHIEPSHLRRMLSLVISHPLLILRSP